MVNNTAKPLLPTRLTPMYDTPGVQPYEYTYTVETNQELSHDAHYRQDTR